jgi:hypothetical protein
MDKLPPTTGLTDLEIQEIHKYKKNKTLPYTYSQLPTILPYRNRSETGRSHETTRVSDNGQRKLALGELQFFTRYMDVNNTIVLYIGSAPGDHIGMIAKRFPSVIFVLYDPRTFHKSLHKLPNVLIRNQLFLDEDCDTFMNEDFMKDCTNLLMISDIRTWEAGTIPTEQNVFTDMNLQRSILEKIKPAHSFLKFRLNYVKKGADPNYEYLDGEIILQSWAPKGSTETRLIVSEIKPKIYDIYEYDSKLYYQKLVEREYGTYPTLMLPGTHHCKCYECYTEYIILKEFAEFLYSGDKDGKGFMSTYSDLNRYTYFQKFADHYKKL